MNTDTKLVPGLIILSCFNGSRGVRGWRIGKLFAVHSGSTHGGGWTLTHTPSGCAVGWFKTRKAAVALALDFIAKVPAPFWSVRTNGGMKRKAKTMPGALAIARELRVKHGQYPIVPVDVPGVEYGKRR